ncbi:hypothetical protein WJX82_010186 [Trebouxia sp. C0006]
MPTERYVSSRPPAIPNKPLCIDQLSSCHLKALVSLAGGYRSSSSSRATLLEAVSSELQSVNSKTWHVSNCKQLSPDRVFGGLVFFGGKFWVYGGFSRLWHDDPAART